MSITRRNYYKSYRPGSGPLFLLLALACCCAAARASAADDAPSAASISKAARLSSAAGAVTPSALVNLGTGGFIEVELSDNGKFTMGTLAGDPAKTTDDNKALLYGPPNPSTGDTMISVDGAPVSIHTGTSSGITTAGDAVSVTLQVGAIQVLERLTIKTSQASGNKDTVEIYFKVTNNSAAAHTVALRTQLDTLLGSNDGAPFRIPGIGEVTKDKEFDNDPATAGIAAIPAQALVLDNLLSPNIISMLTFTGLGYQTPDRVVFGYWPVSVGNWGYIIDSTRSFTSDSSVIVWWGYPAAAFNLGVGQSKEFAILYGIGNCNSISAKQLTVLFCGDTTLQGQAQGASFSYAPSIITAFITNTSAGTVAGGKATLSFPSDLVLSAGFASVRSIEGTAGSGILATTQTAQIDWQLTGYGRRLEERPINLSLDVNGSHYTSLRDIQVKTIAGLLYGQATTEAGAPVAGAAIAVLNGAGAVVAAAVTQADGTYAVSGLAPGSYRVRMSAAGRPDIYFSAAVVSGDSGGQTGNPSAFTAVSRLESFAYPNPARSGRVHISYFLDAAAACELKIYTSSGELIRTMSATAPGAGWSSFDWDIDTVANGVYLYRLKTASGSSDGKIAVLKRKGL